MRVRPDLTAERQRYQGRVYMVVKDPIGLNYFRFQEEEFAILNMLDGEVSLDEIKEMLSLKGLRLGQGLEDAHRAARRHVVEQLKGTGKEVVLARSVTDLKLSVRARKALQLLNIQTFSDLASHTEAELMGVKNFGATSLVEVRERLADHGLGLRTLEEEE